MNYGIKLNFSSQLWTLNVNDLDNSRRPLPLLWCYSQQREKRGGEEGAKTHRWPAFMASKMKKTWYFIWFVFFLQCCTFSFASMFRANCWIPHQKKSKSITAANATVYIKASAASVVIPTSPVQMCLCDISFRSAALLQIIHSLDMSHTETKLYLLLNRISDGAALLENCML